MQDNQQKIIKALEYKEEGNHHFKSQDWKKALTSYHRVFLYINGLVGKDEELSQYAKDQLTDNQAEVVNQLKCNTYANMAQVYIFQGQFEKGRNAALNSLKITKSPKVLYRLAICNIELNNLDEARQQLQEAQSIDPKIDIQKELHQIQQKEKLQDASMAKAMKKMFL